jgi:Zn finger protein HypA/HybF involved in hydrogenase expression
MKINDYLDARRAEMEMDIEQDVHQCPDCNQKFEREGMTDDGVCYACQDRRDEWVQEQQAEYDNQFGRDMGPYMGGLQ